MNIVRERVLMNLTDFDSYSEHNALRSFCVSSDCFTDWDDDDDDEADFVEIIVVVDEEWLFKRMRVKDPVGYLRNEYTSDDSVEWFYDACREHKCLMITFN